MRRLLAVCGLPGSGKTHLMNRALTEDIPLFGEENHADYRFFLNRFMRDDDVDDDDGKNNLAFTLGYPAPVETPHGHHVAVWHVDLIWLYRRDVLGRPGYNPLAAADFERLADDGERQARLLEFIAEKIAPFDEVVICDLKCDYATNKRRFSDRRKRRKRNSDLLVWYFYRMFRYEDRNFIVEDDDERPAFDAISRMWQEDRELFRPVAIHEVEQRGSGYSVRTEPALQPDCRAAAE